MTVCMGRESWRRLIWHGSHVALFPGCHACSFVGAEKEAWYFMLSFAMTSGSLESFA